MSKTTALATKTTSVRSQQGLRAAVLKQVRSTRRQLLASGFTLGRPDAEQKALVDRQSVEMSVLHDIGGATYPEISQALDIPYRTVRDAVARGRMLTASPEAREHQRQCLLAAGWDMAERARVAEDFESERKALAWIGQLEGFTSTGGNSLQVGVQVNTGPTDSDLRQEIRDYLKQTTEPVIERKLLKQSDDTK